MKREEETKEAYKDYMNNGGMFQSNPWVYFKAGTSNEAPEFYRYLEKIIMWRDECGFKHNGPSPYEQRKLAEFRLRMTIEEKYKEKVEEACRWLNNFLYADLNTGNIKVHPLSYKSKKEIIDDFRNIMKLE